MGLAGPASHHRRRSSALAGAARSLLSGSAERREDSSRSYGDVSYKWEEQEPLAAEETDASDVSSTAESLEMDPMISDDDHDDEETGLTAQQRRRRRRRRKQRRKLDARIADVKSSRHDLFSVGLAERNVMKRLMINAILILSWYFFSLAISVVSRAPDGVLMKVGS